MSNDQQPDDLSIWTHRALPSATPLQGRTCRIERLDVERHQSDLAEVFIHAPDEAWAYLPYGPFADVGAFKLWLSGVAEKTDPLFHTIIDVKTAKACGLASLMRIDPANGVIEVGHIHFGPSLKQTPAATEAIFLLMGRVFDELGYRRFEWKCNALNKASCDAAVRFGFTYEGTFRQASVVKGHNRDTAWFSLLDKEWLTAKRAFQAWLAPENFDANGMQRKSLASFRI